MYNKFRITTMAIYDIDETVKILGKYEFLKKEQEEINELINDAVALGCDLSRPGVEAQPKRVGWKGQHAMAKLLHALELAETAAMLGGMEAAKAARRAEFAEMRAERLAKEAKEPPLRKEAFVSEPNWLMGVDGRPVYY